MQKPTTYQQLQPEDRITIATMRQRSFSVRAIARTLERAPSTIAREVALTMRSCVRSLAGAMPAVTASYMGKMFAGA